MTALILLVFAQAAPTQGKPIEERIEAFLKGDDAARAELVKLGAYAIRPLQKARDRAPEEIETLVYELKVAVAHPKCAQVIANLESAKSCGVHIESTDVRTISLMVEGVAGASFLDGIERKALSSDAVNLRHIRVPARLILDDLCRQTGLDYGFFHNTLVVGHPDRLWPSGPPMRLRELSAAEMARARALVEKLDDDAIETRESATVELIKLGPAIVPIVEPNLKRKEAEVVTRCSTVLEKLRTRLRGAFGPAGAERQKKSPEEEKLLVKLRLMTITRDFRESNLADIAECLGEATGIGFEFLGDAGGQVVTIRARDKSLLDLLSLVTQSRDLDFVFRGSKVVIDTREAIDRLLEASK